MSPAIEKNDQHGNSTGVPLRAEAAELNEESPNETGGEIQLVCAARPNGMNTIVLPVLESHYIRLRILDEDEEAVSDAPYILRDDEGRTVAEGTTGAEGLIDHDGLALRDYSLAIGAYEEAVPSVAYPDERLDVFVPIMGFLRVQVFDVLSEPVAEAEYEIFEADGEEPAFEGKTDSEGRVRHDRILFGDYELSIRCRRGTIPAVAHEDESFSVFFDSDLWPLEATEEEQSALNG